MQSTINSSIALFVLVLAITLVATTSACFVRNCPPGGKRSMDSFVHPQRECLRCGPEGLGQCVGPNICCGPNIGCYINSAEAAACQKENDIHVPCQVEGDLCGRLGEGRCVTSGVCCSDERCELDDACAQTASSSATNGRSVNSDFTSNIALKHIPGSHLSPEVVKFLRKLFDRKSYAKRK